MPAMVERPLRVAIFGAGYGAYCLVPAFQRDPRVAVVALCAPTAARRDAAAERHGIADTCASVDEVLDRIGIDAVAIAVPPDAQAEIAFACLARQIPVFAEKPLGSDLSTAHSLVEAAHKADVVTAVDFLFPEVAIWREAKIRLSAGAIGPLHHVVLNWVMESYDNRNRIAGWKTEAAGGGGAMSHFGSHMLHYLEWFCGPISSLRATLARPPGYHASGDTLATLAATFASGVSVSATLCSGAPFGTGHRIDFYGENGNLTLVNDTASYLDFRLYVQRLNDAEAREVVLPDPACHLPDGTWSAPVEWSSLNVSA